MRELETGSDEPTIRPSTVLPLNRTTTMHPASSTSPVAGPSTVDNMDATSSTSLKYVHEISREISGSPTNNGGTKSQLTTFQYRNSLIKQRLTVETFDKPIPTANNVNNNPDTGKKRPRIASGNTHNRVISWADIVENNDNPQAQRTDPENDIEDTDVSSRGDKDVRKYLSPHLMPFYSQARNCLIKQGKQEIRNDYHQKCIDENIVIHELAVTPILPQGITLDPHEKARWSLEKESFEARLMILLKEKGVNTLSQLDSASTKALFEFQKEMDRINLPLDSTQKSIDILVEKVGSSKASYRLLLTKQFMEVRKECNLFRKDHNFLSRRVPQRDQRPNATTQGSSERRPSPRRPTPLVSPIQNRGPQFPRYRSRSPRAPTQQRNQRSPNRSTPNQNPRPTNRDDRILNFLEEMSTRIGNLERSNQNSHSNQSNPRPQMVVHRPSQYRGRQRGQRGGRR